MSSTMIELSLPGSLHAGCRVELVLAWPVLLDQRTHLNFWVFGGVTEVEGSRARVEITRYEFRTRSSPVKEVLEGITESVVV